MASTPDDRTVVVDICPDCEYLLANGWDPQNRTDWSPDYPGLLPEWEGWLFGRMVTDEDNDYCPPFFSKSSCDGCGDRLAGTRTTYLATPGPDTPEEYR